MSAAIGQLTPPPTVVKSASAAEETGGKRDSAGETEKEGERKKGMCRQVNPHPRSSVVKQNPLAIRGQGCDAVSPRSRRTHPLATASRSLAAVSHRHPSIAISPHPHRRGFTALAPAAALPFAPPPPFSQLMPRHVLSNTYTRIKIRAVNPNKREDVHSTVCVHLRQPRVSVCLCVCVCMGL